jgi:phenylacetate-coenzyme A ligase PaaK-like adenylate-forming protein
VNNLDRLTLQVEIRGLDEMSDEKQAELAKAFVTGVKTIVGVSPKIELHAPYALPRDTAGQGKTACHRVDDRRAT